MGVVEWLSLFLTVSVFFWTVMAVKSASFIAALLSSRLI